LLERVAAMAERARPADDEPKELDPFAQLDAETSFSDDPVEDERIHREMRENQARALGKGRRKPGRSGR
jgi:hypothetical protein